MYEDMEGPLSGATGIMYGLLISLFIWGLIFLIIGG
jgi:hypothetical protein